MKNNFISNIRKSDLSKDQQSKLNDYILRVFNETSSELITVRLTPYEKTILQKAAISNQMTLTDLIKLFILKDLFLKNE